MANMRSAEGRTGFRTMIGGQAIIEGIMMRGPQKQSIVVRAPEGIVVKEEELKLVKERHPILGWPLIRGTVVFLDSMVKGVQALTFSASYYPDEAPGEPSRFEQWLEKKLGSEKLEKMMVYVAVFLGICLSVGLFMLLPTFLAGFLDPYAASNFARNLVEGVIRIVLFLIYMIVISRMKDMKRIFSYHGAEHKTIFCYEAGEELTVENVRKQSRFHPRCGTSFLFVVMIISILVFSLATWSNVAVRMLLRLALLPVVVGLSYELNRYVGGHDNWLTRVLSAPGLWFQRFTTNEPDDSMIEVGIEALRRVLPEKKGEDRW